MGNPALCELLNGDVASLVGVNFGNKSCVSRFISLILVLVDLELNLTRSILLSCSSSRDHLQVALLHLGELLIQIGSLIPY